MYGVELYAAVRLAVVDEGLSHHEAGRRFGIDRRTVKRMLSYAAPPGYRRTKPVRRPKLDGFTGIVDAILEADTDPDVPRKQRRTKPVRRPKLDGFTGIVDAILEADTDPDVPRKQRHTAHRIFERLRDEHGFSAATRSRPCENSGGDGDGGLGHHDLRRSHVIWRFGAGSPAEGAPGLGGSMWGARFWLDSRLMPSRRRSRREHLPARSRGGCCKPAP